MKLQRTAFETLGAIVGVLGGIAVIGACGLSLYVARTWDRIYDIPEPALQASTDRSVIARGEYLVYGPARCAECHTASWDHQRVIQGERVPLRGGRRFDTPPLGVIYSKNLTPDSETGIGRYTDAQIARMMRRSVRPDGRAAPQALMPFHNMSDEDLVAVLSFLRAQRPARHIVRPNEFTVLGKIVKSVTEGYKPRRAEEVHPPPASPPEAPTRERGEYLARHVADCAGCHTPRHRITFRQAGPEFSGNTMAGAALPRADPAVRYAAPDITPARGSALTKYRDRGSFVARFKAGTRHPPGSPMPWEAYSLMSEADLGALYEFLRSLPAADGPAGDFNRRAAN